MGAYRATILLLTAGMIVLHLLEWLAARNALRASHGGTGDRLVRSLRPALRLEAVYYLVAFPAFCGVPNKWVGHLMMVSAAYHWLGFALFEINGLRRKKETWTPWTRIGRSAMWAIGLLDLAEVVALASLGRALYAFLLLWQ